MGKRCRELVPFKRSAVLVEPANLVFPPLAGERCELVVSLEDREFMVRCRFGSVAEFLRYVEALTADPGVTTAHPYVYTALAYYDPRTREIHSLVYGRFVRSVAVTSGLKTPVELDPLYATLMLLYRKFKKAGYPVREPRGVNMRELYRAYFRGELVDYYAEILGVPPHIVRAQALDLLVDPVEPPDPLFFDFIKKVGYILGVKEYIDYAENRDYETAKRFEDARWRTYRLVEPGEVEDLLGELDRLAKKHAERLGALAGEARKEKEGKTGRPPVII